MKTAIEKAIEDIEGYRSFGDTIEIRFVCALLKNVYLQQEKQQIIDACNQPYFDDIAAMGKPITKGEQYYDETYGSKGSDEHIEDNLEEIPTSSQTEISDEEIKDAALKEYNNNDYQYKHWEIDAWISACKWYREQLKSK